MVLCGCSQPLPLQRPTPVSSNVAPEAATVLLQQTFVAEATVAVASAASPEATMALITPTDFVPTEGVIASPTAIATLVGTPVVVVPPTQAALSGEAAWEAQQANRQNFGEERRYTATTAVSLFWFDPVTGQRLEVGRLIGGFVATAQFELRFQDNAEALAVPYRIDQDYGLTAISPAVKARMQAAGYNDRIEGYVLLGDSVVPAATAHKPEQINAAFDILLSS